MVDRFLRKMFLSYVTSFKYLTFTSKCQLCFSVNAKYVAVTALDELAILLLRKQLVKVFPLIALYLKVVFFQTLIFGMHVNWVLLICFLGNKSLSIDIPIPYFAQNYFSTSLRS